MLVLVQSADVFQLVDPLANVSAESSRTDVDVIPSAPGNLTAERYGRIIILNWTEPEHHGASDLNKYAIERSEDGHRFTIWTRVQPEVNTYDMENYYWGEVNHFRVVAENENGSSPPSNVASILMADPPTEPRNFVAKPKNDRVELKWSPPFDDGGVPVTQYHVIKTQNVNEYQVAAILNGSARGYIDKDVEPGVSFYYGVIAKNVVGSSQKPGLVAVSPYGSPSEPLDLKYIEIDEKSVLQWEMPVFNGGAELTRFTVHRGSRPDMMRNHSIKSPDDLVHTIEEHPPGDGYYYAVTASNEFGASSLSNIVYIENNGVPERPRNLRARYRIDHVVLAWEPPFRNGGSNVTEYLVYRQVEDGKKELIAQLPWWVHTYTDDDTQEMENGKDITYHVHSVNRYGEEDQGAAFSLYITENEFSWTFTMILLGILIAPAGITWIISGLAHIGRKNKKTDDKQTSKGPKEEKTPDNKKEQNGIWPPLSEKEKEEQNKILEAGK